ncbi:hypothetical protein [Dyella amyloliquefaciens]|uniref:hypothetical protein n=1 Tax=Dyella amyloliquefaciens TaxID=1770545 RepID=UPI00102EAD0F|nr:hypothetical protein [Dyella amyloliquefaciens]
MADSYGAPSAIAKAGGALFALVYVLPLTGAVLFALGMSPAMLPRGWPAGVPAQALALLSIVLLSLTLPSVLVLWYLVVGFVRHGAAWVTSRSPWLRWGALVTPVAMLWSAIRRAQTIYGSSLTDAGRAMGDVYWSYQFTFHSLYLGWSLLFLLGVALVRFSAKRRTL